MISPFPSACPYHTIVFFPFPFLHHTRILSPAILSFPTTLTFSKLYHHYHTCYTPFFILYLALPPYHFLGHASAPLPFRFLTHPFHLLLSPFFLPEIPLFHLPFTHQDWRTEPKALLVNSQEKMRRLNEVTTLFPARPPFLVPISATHKSLSPSLVIKGLSSPYLW